MAALDPGAVAVPCGPLRATLYLRSCLLRHVAVWPSGHRAGAPRFPVCAACPAGALRLRRAAWFEPPAPSQPRETLDNVQRAARERWQRSFPMYSTPEIERLNPFVEIALAAPDDHGVAIEGAAVGG